MGLLGGRGFHWCTERNTGKLDFKGTLDNIVNIDILFVFVGLHMFTLPFYFTCGHQNIPGMWHSHRLLGVPQRSDVRHVEGYSDIEEKVHGGLTFCDDLVLRPFYFCAF